MKKLLAPLAIIMIGLVILAGCASPKTSTTSPATSTPATSAPATTTTTAATSKPATTTPASTSVAQVYGGTLRIAMTVDATSLGYPPKMQGTPDQLSARPAIEPLFRQDNSGAAVPYLVDTVKEDPAAKTITFNVKKGIKFHDGTPFNAEAVKWNLMNFKASPAGGNTFANLDSIDVVDEYTARLNMKNWDNTLINNLASAPPGYIISPAAFQAKGEDWCRNNPVGTGPFKFVSWTRDVKKVWEKNPDYWQKGKPYLDKVEIVVIADPTVEVASLMKGEIDTIAMAQVKDVDAMAKQGFATFKCQAGGGLRTIVGDSAHADSPYANQKVRQAISYAIDKQPIIDSVWKGVMPVTNQFAMPNTWAYNANVVGYPYNPTKAKQLLSEAGYSNLKTPLYALNDPYQVSTYTAVQNYLQAVGITVDLQVLDSGKYVDMQMNTGWNNALYGLGVLCPPDPAGMMNTMFRKTSTSTTSKMIQKFDDIEAALTQMSGATDFDTKKKVTWELQSLIFDTHTIWNPLFVNVDLSIKTKKVHDDGIDTTPFGIWTPENAWMEK